jgi:formyl-CoA transferase
MRVIERPDLENDPALRHNDGRVAQVEMLDAAIEAWTVQRSRDEVLAVLDAAGVPVGRIYTVADIASDPQYLAREMIVEAPTSDGRTLKVPGIVPKLSATPGRIAHPAPRLGEHDDQLRPGAGWPARTR